MLLVTSCKNGLFCQNYSHYRYKEFESLNFFFFSFWHHLRKDAEICQNKKRKTLKNFWKIVL